MNFIEKLREKHRLNIAVKEALDNLPTAVCYFTADGSVKLCNTAMYDVYRMMTGKDLQSFGELTAAIDECDKDTGIIRDGNIFLFPDGCARQYSGRRIRTEDGRTYIETLFSNVTELYEKRRKLEQQSEEMKKMYAELKVYSGQLLEITREQEILNMKAQLHDQMNIGITAIRQILLQNTTSEENSAAIARFRRAVQILQEENAYPQDDLGEFLQDAKTAGVRVILSGSLPEERENRSLLIEVLREACINAVRYADATVLNITSVTIGETVQTEITNDGRAPEREIVPRGGLKDLGERIGKAGGMLKIRSLPTFLLTVTLPLGSRKQGKRKI